MNFNRPLVCVFASSLFLNACDRPAQPTSPTDVPDSSQASAPPTPVSYPSTGPDLVAYVAQRYPEKLAAGVSREERIANMEFLRDRMIETGICGGMDIGWNMKRGGPEKSRDFVAWHDGRRRMGVDIARAYDAPHRPLQLVWAVHGPTPHYREYEPRPQCRQPEAGTTDTGDQRGKDQDDPIDSKTNLTLLWILSDLLISCSPVRDSIQLQLPERHEAHA